MTSLRELASYRPATASRLTAVLGGPTAILLLGPRGTGIEEVALAAAAALVCESGGCGACDSCRRVAEGHHPDVIVAEGEPTKPLAIEELRRLVRTAALAPIEGRARVVVVPSVDRALAGFPVLLKAIEEPPPTTRWLLTASGVPGELAPIASRCVRVPIEPPTVEELRARLAERGLAPTEELLAVLRGRPGLIEALAALPDPVEYFAQWSRVPELARAEARWGLALAHRLDPGERNPFRELLLVAGLEVLLATAEPPWARRVERAALSLARHLPVRLVLAELVLRPA